MLRYTRDSAPERATSFFLLGWHQQHMIPHLSDLLILSYPLGHIGSKPSFVEVLGDKIFQPRIFRFVLGVQTLLYHFFSQVLEDEGLAGKEFFQLGVSRTRVLIHPNAFLIERRLGRHGI